MKSISNKPIRIAIFASGAGSNAHNLCRYFSDKAFAEVGLMLTHNPNSGLFDFALEVEVPVLLLSQTQYQSGAYLNQVMQNYQIDLIVLAGYLKKIPPELVAAFPQRMVNIHPALLPDFGGKGMYGQRVHQAVLAAGKKYSGITIHYVDNVYDNGEIIFQASLKIEPHSTPVMLQQAIHALEYKYYPLIVENVCKNLLNP